MAALALLVHTQTKTAADLLTLGELVSAVHERAYLEDVRVVPALFERGVAEDERDVLHVVLAVGKADQTLLGLHDGLEGGGVGSGRAGGVLHLPLAVHGKVALMQRSRIYGQRHALLLVTPSPRAVSHLVGILLLEYAGVPSRAPGAVVVVDAVLLHFVDEEEREHLDAQGI